MTQTVPGPRPFPGVGTLYELNPLYFKDEANKGSQKYGEYYRHVFPGEGPVTFVGSYRLVNELSDQKRFDKRVHASFREIRRFVGNGLFTADTDNIDWQKGHRILMPAFNRVALERMYRNMVDCADQLLLKWKRMPEGEIIDTAEDFTRVTLDTIALTSFSYRFNSFYSAEFHPFVDAFQRNLELTGPRALIPDFLKKLTQATYDKNTATVQEFVDELIRDRQQHPSKPGEEDLLDVMLSAQDATTGTPLSMENVRDQLLTFLIAGHETTSSLLAFTVYRLLSNPHVFQKARDHVDTVLGDRFPEFDDLQNLTYIDEIMFETLRLNPPVWAYAVRPLEKTIIGKDEQHEGYEVDVDETVLILLDRLHRDPEVWNDPETFRPERFNVENGDYIAPNAWKPFGHGQRSCIGRAFALQEAKIILALLVRHFDVEFADPDYELDTSGSLAQKPNDFRIRIFEREGHPYQSPGADAVRLTGGDISGSLQEEEAVAAASNGQTLNIFVGSNAGICRNLAGRLRSMALAQGFATDIYDLDEGINKLSADNVNLIVTSSYEGEPPDNARKFFDWLQQDATAADVAGVRYAVFGAGNIEWTATYQRVPTLVDQRLHELGATRLQERGAGDVHTDYLSPFEEWNEQLWPVVAEATGTTLQTGVTEDAVEVENLTSSRTSVLRATDTPDYITARVVANEKLSTDKPGLATNKYRIALELPAGQSYHVGDYLDVLPSNPPAVVHRVLQRFGYSPNDQIALKGGSAHLPLHTPIAVADLLSNYCELSVPAGKRQILTLAGRCPCPPEAAALQAFAGDQYEAEIAEKRRSVLDLLEMYRSIDLSFAEFLGMLPPLLPRRYSISSAPLASEHTVSLTYSRVQGPARSGQGEFAGVATNWMAQLQPGTRVSVSVVPAKSDFQGEADLQQPMILIGAGSGMAPLRAFLEQRAAEVAAARNAGEEVAVAKSLLFFGCHTRESDFLYAEELAQWEQDGIVEVLPAFSRAAETHNGVDVKYISERVWAERETVMELLRTTQARIFVCGDAGGFAADIRAVLRRIVAELEGLDKDADADAAAAAFRRFEHEEHRLATDFFA